MSRVERSDIFRPVTPASLRDPAPVCEDGGTGGGPGDGAGGGATRARRRIQARMVIAAGDAIALLVGVGVISLIRLLEGERDQVGHVMLTLVPLFQCVALYHHAYDRDAIRDWPLGCRRAVSALVVAFLIVAGVAFAFKIGASYSRTVVLVGVVLGAALLVVGRWASGRIARALLPGGVVDSALLVDGTMAGVHEPGDAVVDTRALGLEPRLDDPAMIDRIGRVLRGCERVVVACAPQTRDAWTAVLKGLGVEVQVLVPELETLGMLGTDRHGRHLTAVVALGPLRPTDLALKRLFDLGVVIALGPALLLVTLLVAIAIKIDDRGPVFFRQTRMGQGNRLFRILKFRTMHHAASDHGGTLSASRTDDRVTRVGWLLRRTSLDELPQLFNVLGGSMSIVGPRPHALGSLAGEALFWDADHRYWLRHVVKPGLTGLAQVRGFRGATARTHDLTDRVQADLDYISGWTIWRDVRIALETGRVLLHPNAY